MNAAARRIRLSTEALIDKHMTEALNAFQDGNFDRAMRQFEKCIRLGDAAATVREAAALSAVRAGEWTRAAKHWLVLAEGSPRRPGPISQHVTALIRANRLDRAEAFCRSHQLLRAETHASLKTSLLIAVHLAKGEPEAAAAEAEAHCDGPPSPSQALEFAQRFFEYRVFAAAHRWLAQAEAEPRLAPRTLLLRARLAYAEQQWEDAEAAFLRLESQAPPHQAESARIYLARIAQSTGRDGLAEQRYQRVLADNPLNQEAASFFVRAALGDGDAAAALRLIDEHGQAFDAVQRVQFRARALAMRNPEAAVALYSDAVAAMPNLLALRLGLAGFLLDLNRLAAAEAELVACLQLAPDGIETNALYLKYLQKADAPVSLQLDQARKALDLVPLDVGLLNTVGNLLARCNRRADAVRHYQGAVEKVPQAAVLWRNGTYHLMMENRLEDAATFADRGVAAIGTRTAEQLANAAWIMQASGETDRALNYIGKAVELAPDSVSALATAVDLQMAAGHYATAWGLIGRLDTLHFPRRTERIAHAAAQCMAAFRAVAAAGQIEAACPQLVAATRVPLVSDIFPDALFHALVATAQPDAVAGRAGIVHFSSNLGAGGAERQVAYVMQAMSARPPGAEPVSLVVNSVDSDHGNDFFLAEVQASGCAVTDLDHQREQASIRAVLATHPDHAGQVRALAALPAELSRMAIPFYAHLVRHRPRIVHLWQDAVNVAGGIAAVAAGVPQIVLCTRSTRPVEIRRFRRYLRAGYLALLAYRGQVRIVNNSANGARDYEAWLGLAPGQVEVFYNGYDFAAIRSRRTAADRPRIRAALAIPPTAPVIGGVMRFSAEKRPDLWLDTVAAAADQHPGLHGIIVGDGPMREDLIALTASRGLAGRIHFPGRQTPVEPWMSAMDILFLSSVTEGLPNVLIEAQALEVPVATMNVGGAPEALAPGQSGLVLDAAPPAALAARILVTLDDAAAMASMRQAAAAFVNARFALSAMTDRLEEFYERPALVRSPRRVRPC